MTSPNWSIATAAAAILLLAACSNEGGTQPANTAALAREIAACPLLTQQEVGQAAGVTMFAGEERPPIGAGPGSGRMTTCSWKEDIDGPAPTIITLLVWSWPPGSNGAANYLASFRKAAEEFPDLPEPEPVELGEEASWDGTSLHARAGDVSISISVSKPDVDAATARAASETLARLVLDRVG